MSLSGNVGSGQETLRGNLNSTPAVVGSVNHLEKIKGGISIMKLLKGGHYTPVVTQPAEDAMLVAFEPSMDEMPEVEPVLIDLPTGAPGEPGRDGEDGQNGVTPNIQIGTVTTLNAGEKATVTRSGTDENPVFNFGIPKGADGQGGGGSGEPGPAGEDGATFTPYVDASGNLSWTNDKGLPNPASVNIKGSKGDPGNDYVLTAEDKREIALSLYPVNSIYICYSETSPASLFGGTWQRMEDAFLWGCGADGEIGSTGGEMFHALTEEEMPSHNHDSITISNRAVTPTGESGSLYKLTGSWNGRDDGEPFVTSYSGNGEAHNNMPPYISVAIWRRVA